MNTQEIVTWLQKDVKLKRKVNNLKEDFQTGYLFKDVLFNLGYSVPQEFYDKKDKAMMQQNYMYLKDFCKTNFGINLTSDKSSTKHLDYLQQLFEFFNQNNTNGNTRRPQVKSLSALNTQKRKQETIDSYYEKVSKNLNKTDKKLLQYSYQNINKQILTMPPKILKIEEQLEKYREEKVRHEIKAKILKQQEEEDLNMFRQEQRQVHLEKLRANNQYIKDIDKRIYENWKNTEMVKQKRIDEEHRLQDFLTGKILTKLKQEQEFEEKDFEDGLDYFYQNCQRQGIDLNHDPDEEKKEVKKANFSVPATMMKIKERTKKNQEARKARQQRKNKMMVDQVLQQEKVDKKKKEEDFLKNIFENCAQENIEGWQKIDEKITKKIQADNRLQSSNKQNDELLAYFEEQNRIQAENSEQREKERKEMIRQKELEYMEQALERKQKYRQKHTQQCSVHMDKILDLVEVCFQKQQATDSIQISQTYWDDLMKRFVSGQAFTDEKVFKIFDSSQQQHQQSSSIQSQSQIQSQSHQSQSQQGSQQEILQQSQQKDKQLRKYEDLLEYEYSSYLNAQFQWAPNHFYDNNNKSQEDSKQNRPQNNNVFGDFLCELVDKLHPKVPEKPTPEDLPQHLPLKISLIGNKFSGKKTIANLLKQKYQLELIDPQQLISEALKLAFPPEEDEADKKKKKDPKKQQEEPKPENEELKALGFEINEFTSQDKEVPDILIVKAIIAKLKELFPKQSNEELLQEIKESEEQEAKRLEDIEKQNEDLKKKQAKKPGKDPKKKAAQDEPAEQEPEKTPQELLKEALEQPKISAFSKGFVLFNFPTTEQQSKLLEENFTGYVPEYDRLNETAEFKKQTLSQMYSPSPVPPQTDFTKSGIDLYITVQSDVETCQKRADQRRIDPQTEQIYNLEIDAPTDQKLLDRLKELDSEKENIENYENYLRMNSDKLYTFLSQFGNNEGKYEALNLIETNGNVFQNFQGVENALNVVLQHKKQKLDIFKEEQEQEILRKQQEEQEQQEQKEKEEQQQKEQEQQQQQQQQEGEQQEQQQPEEGEGQQQQEQQEQEVQKEEEQVQEQKTDENINVIQTLNPDILTQINEIWEDIQKQYVKDSQSIFLHIIKHREQISSRSMDVQKRFLQIMEKKDDKQKKINAFQDNFNKFYNDNSVIMKYQSTRDELSNHLDQLYESLWDSLEIKKNMAQEERNNIVCSGWIESEMEQIFKFYLRLFQMEINKLQEIIELFYYIMDTLEERPINEVQEHVILEPFKTENPPIENQETQTYPKIQLLYTHYLETVDNIQDQIKEMRIRFQRRRLGRNFAKIKDLSNEPLFKSVDKIFQNILVYEKQNLRIRGLILKNTLIQRIQEIRNLGSILYNKMDDWIIFGLKSENDVIYQAMQYFKTAIKEQQPANVPALEYTEISETYKLHKNFSLAYQNFIQHVEKPVPYRFTIQQLHLLINEIKSITDHQGIVNPNAFYQLFNRRKNSKQCQSNLPSDIIKLTDDQIKFMIFNLNAIYKIQFGSSNNKERVQKQSSIESQNQQYSQQQQIFQGSRTINFERYNSTFTFKQLFTCFVLLGSSVPGQQHCIDWKEGLQKGSEAANQDEEEEQEQQLQKDRSAAKCIGFQEFLEVPAWFDQFEGDDNEYEGYHIDRNRYIKTVLFQLYANKQDTVDIEQLISQISKYGELDKASFWDVLFMY